MFAISQKMLDSPRMEHHQAFVLQRLWLAASAFVESRAVPQDHPREHESKVDELTQIRETISCYTLLQQFYAFYS